MKCRVNVLMFEEIIQSSTIRNLKNSAESLHVGICSLMVKRTRSRRFQWFLRVFVNWKKRRALINQLHHDSREKSRLHLKIETKKSVPLFSSIPDAVLLMFFGFGHPCFCWVFLFVCIVHQPLWGLPKVNYTLFTLLSTFFCTDETELRSTQNNSYI